MTTDTVDFVNHPPHYNNHPSGVECIQITEHMGFNLGNVIKYVWRADEKGEALEDLSKARFYLDREIARREYLSQQANTEPLNFQSIFDEVMGWGLASEPEDNKDLAFWVNEDEDGDLELVIPLGDEDDHAPGDPVGVAASDIPEGSQVSLVYDDDTDAVTFHPVFDGETAAPTVETTVTDVYIDLLTADFDPRIAEKVNAIAATDEFRDFSQWVADKLAELHADELFQDAHLSQRATSRW